MADERLSEEATAELLSAIGRAVQGTDWAPPEGGVVTEAVVIMVWMQPNGEMGASFYPATNHHWSARGLLDWAVAYHKSDQFEEDE